MGVSGQWRRRWRTARWIRRVRLRRRLAGAQQHGHWPARSRDVDMDRQEAAAHMSVTERGLLIAVHDFAGVVKIQRHRRWWSGGSCLSRCRSWPPKSSPAGTWPVRSPRGTSSVGWQVSRPIPAACPAPGGTRDHHAKHQDHRHSRSRRRSRRCARAGYPRADKPPRRIARVCSTCY